MTTEKRIARTKLSLLELAQQLGNVSKACKVMGYSREQFYEIRRNYQSFGADGLLDKISGAKGPHPNRVSEEIEKAILEYSLYNPAHGAVRTANDLRLKGIQVSSGGVRGVWGRHQLLTKMDRFLNLEKQSHGRRIELTEDQIRALERFSPEFRERHIVVNKTAELVCVDTFFVGVIKGVGKVYLQTALDGRSRFAFARYYNSKLPLTSVHLMNNDVLPFFEEQGLKIQTVLSDNGREFCGRLDHHPYELFLQLEEIAHRTTKVKRPQSNGFIERFHRTLLDEHIRVVGRTKWYENLEQMQEDLDVYLRHYNYERTHQGRNMNGLTPHQVFKDNLPDRTSEEDDMNPSAA